MDKARKQGDNLLIVPYGIETSKSLILFAVPWPFNRTLWN